MVDTPFRTYLASGVDLNLLPVFNVQDAAYSGGAVGNGTDDDSLAIQAAVDAAIAAGGGIVWFPPLSGSSNYYRMGSAITFSAFNVPIHLLGVGGIDNYGSRLNGSVAGGIISQSYPGSQVLRSIRGLSITNTHASGGGILWDNSQNGVIEDCFINAVLFGIQSNIDTYCLEVRNCSVVCSSNYAGIGIHITQGAVHQCSVQGWDVGIQTRNSGFIATGNRIEVCQTGIRLGAGPDGSWDAIQGCSILSNQTERCLVALDIINAQAGIIAGNTWTATVGPHHAISAMVWASTAGGTVTATSVTDLEDWSTWDSGAVNWDPWDTNTQTKSIKIENSNFNTGSSFVTATRTGAKTFTYPLADPGAPWDAAQTLWSFKPQFGMRLKSATGLMFGPNSPVDLTNLEQVGIDLKYFGITTVSGVVFNGTQGGTWRYPDKQGACYTFVNCDNPVFSMLFRDLPGEAGFDAPATAIEGMEFNITNAQKSGGGTAAFGDIVQAGGSQRAKVRYNGTNWTCCGL